jgi:hypothetical protein
MSNKEKPEVKVQHVGSIDRLIQEHPAYGMVTITHPQGGDMEMFGSDTTHNQRVCLRISQGYQDVTSGIPTYYEKSRQRIVEVEMTAYQWASLVACHSGQGVPVTLRHVKGEDPIPRIVGQKTTSELSAVDIKKDLQKMLKEYEDGLSDLESMITSGKVSKAGLKTAYSKLTELHRKLPETTDFAVRMFQENTEVIKAQAQAEFEASVNRVILNKGMEGLGISPIVLENKENE